MKKCFVSILILLTVSVFSQTIMNSEIFFTENKGQIRDQFDVFREDILFSGHSQNFTYHLRNDGISYQLYTTSKTLNTPFDGATKKIEVPIITTKVNRIDVMWLGVSSNFEIIKDGMVRGYDNFYLNGSDITNVKSYSGVWYKEIYKGIDVHYYDHKGILKYDFIVKPHENYKQIKLKIEGAEQINLNEDGSVSLKTMLGEVTEGCPIVFQRGKKISAKWHIEKNILSLKVDSYDPKYELIIDPATRLWSTYYGGTIGDAITDCVTDASRNLFVTGETWSISNIATIGSYQLSLSGSADAFIVKFDSVGVRQWGTYYGGPGVDISFACAIDNSGDLFVSGHTDSNSGIATSGAHQTTFGGGVNAKDAFLVKFNTNGIRQWATYYGGTGHEIGFGCDTDVSGNVFLTGGASSPNNISTPGSHQPVWSGAGDGFLVKFNSLGVRQWGTYYGGGSTGYGTSCSVDASGNVYMYGHTTATTGISTPGSHQVSHGSPASGWDAFLVKFTNNGVRLWGTYYGGNGSDATGSCKTDAQKNIYITGNTNSSVSISTPAGHQTVFVGPTNFDAFLVKFDSLGVRQWGTYYGNVHNDAAWECTVDYLGNVYMTGEANSTVVISAPGGFQQTIGASPGSDAFLAKFSPNGIRQCATYYGGTSNDYAMCCTSDLSGNIYIAGITQSTNAISTIGSHQSVIAGQEDGFIVKFDKCTPPLPPSNITPSTNLNVCVNSSATLTAYLNSANINWFDLPVNGSPLGTGTLFVTPSLTVAGTYTFYAEALTCTASAIRTPFSITVSPSPTISAASQSICSGSTATIIPSGSPTYTISGNSFVVTPSVTSSYTIVGSNTLGCLSNTVVSTVTVVPNPTVTVNSGTVCSGSAFTINPSGCFTYTVTGNNFVVTPSITSSYTVTCTNSVGCVTNNAAISTVTVNTPVNVVSTSSIICRGSSVTLLASGAVSYTWNTSQNSNSISVSPTVSTTYTVSGTDTYSCITSAVITQSVVDCTSIKSEIKPDEFIVYPNPHTDNFILNSPSEIDLVIYNVLSEIVLRVKLRKGINQISTNNQPKGLYFLLLGNQYTIKIIKQ